MHTEVLTDGVMDLMISGVVNNVEKALVRTKTATSFALGTRRLYDFVDSNPVVEFLPVSWVNNPVRDPVHSLGRALSIVLSFNSTHTSLSRIVTTSLAHLLSRSLVHSLSIHLPTSLPFRPSCYSSALGIHATCFHPPTLALHIHCTHLASIRCLSEE